MVHDYWLFTSSLQHLRITRLTCDAVVVESSDCAVLQRSLTLPGYLQTDDWNHRTGPMAAVKNCYALSRINIRPAGNWHQHSSPQRLMARKPKQMLDEVAAQHMLLCCGTGNTTRKAPRQKRYHVEPSRGLPSPGTWLILRFAQRRCDKEGICLIDRE